MSTTVVLRAPEGAIVEVQGVLISYWLAAWSRETVLAFYPLFSAVKQRQPKGVGTLMIFRTDAIDARAFADEATRKELMRLSSAFDGYFRQTAMVLEGVGFVAAALRSAAWALSAVMRTSTVPKYFDRIDDAAQFASTNWADLAVSKDSVLRAAEAARAAADVKPRA